MSNRKVTDKTNCKLNYIKKAAIKASSGHQNFAKISQNQIFVKKFLVCNDMDVEVFHYQS